MCTQRALFHHLVNKIIDMKAAHNAADTQIWYFKTFIPIRAVSIAHLLFEYRIAVVTYYYFCQHIQKNTTHSKQNSNQCNAIQLKFVSIRLTYDACYTLTTD